jgi:prepilin-type N-terminal cleavage/methylation domain-containing protein
MRSKIRGFTLVELLIVIIIVAVLASVAIPKFQNSSQRAQEGALKEQLKRTREAVDKFYNDCGGMPISLADLAAPTSPPKVLNPAGNQRTLQPGLYQGPYLLMEPKSPVKGGSLLYIDDKTNPKGVGAVTHTPGVALDGTNFSNW